MTTPQTDKTTATPRTDAATYGKMNGVYVTPYVDAEFARQLETELTTAMAEVEEAKRALRMVIERQSVSAPLMRSRLNCFDTNVENGESAAEAFFAANRIISIS
jgi:hypothetical protein